MNQLEQSYEHQLRMIQNVNDQKDSLNAQFLSIDGIKNVLEGRMVLEALQIIEHQYKEGIEKEQGKFNRKTIDIFVFTAGTRV